jgi:hypothetical protein
MILHFKFERADLFSPQNPQKDDGKVWRWFPSGREWFTRQPIDTNRVRAVA